MVDYKLFKYILQQEDAEYIEDGDKIDYKTLDLLTCAKIEKVKRLFKKSNSTSGMRFLVEIKCSECRKFEYINISKTGLFNLMQDLRNGKDTLCLECKAKKHRLMEEERKKTEEYDNIKRAENTEEYIRLYLDPSNSWKAGMKTYQKIESLKYVYIDIEKVKNHILSMPYKSFLLTPYWKAIAEQVKRRAENKCQICGKNTLLNVHHRTYENHGMELYYQKDLICLCKDCHEVYHDKLKEL